MPPVPVRPAATVMLLRDAPHGLEALMLQRTHAAVFSPGAYVFPGGALDPEDADLAHRCAGVTDAMASETLGIPSGGLAYWVAAVRECFEEAGVLLTTSVDFADRDVVERFAKHRDALNDGTRTFAEICDDEDLVLDTAGIRYFGHFITPEGGPRRFDTRFLATRCPAHQIPSHEGGELIDCLWITPRDALDRFAGVLIPPTEYSLRAAARYADTGSLLTALDVAEPKAANAAQGTLL